MELVTGLLDKYGLAVVVVLALGYAFWKLGGKVVTSLERFFDRLVDKLEQHRTDEVANHGKVMSELTDFRRAMLEQRDMGDEDDDLVPVGGLPRKFRATNGQRRKL